MVSSAIHLYRKVYPKVENHWKSGKHLRSEHLGSNLGENLGRVQKNIENTKKSAEVHCFFLIFTMCLWRWGQFCIVICKKVTRGSRARVKSRSEAPLPTPPGPLIASSVWGTFNRRKFAIFCPGKLGVVGKDSVWHNSASPKFAEQFVQETRASRGGTP